uniref:J domain-containing protein n=1 Tax=Picocystis salinarum TaxID=88271 RepID=A0A7S3UFH2_9CHLO|mmetsp:Transcript_5722/g.35642  ORF Transcript_5722/g.35642 Transcript_5722/m.35642 type:complete len:114 (-) Transcript_5722:1017-1358(-)
MAARILANLILAGTEILVRVAIQSYKQTVVQAQRNGSAQAAATGGRSFLRKTMTAEEAYMILGLDSNATREEIMKKYQHLFDVNEKHGSFYLQSKVYRARERLEQELKRRGEV